MRTTLEVSDELMSMAQVRAEEDGISLPQFSIEAVSSKLSLGGCKLGKAPPAIGDAGAETIGALSRQQVDEAMFG
jgi:hypothetical protein